MPSAPFVTDRNKWTALAIKRLIKIADEGDYDAIAFSPGKVQLDTWGKKSLVDYYDKIIPQVASKLPKSLGVTTEKINITIPKEEPIGGVLTSESRMPRINQETFAINVTPKMKEKAKSGIPLFGFGGAIGAGSTMGALGNMPSTQDNET